jgi:protein-tyrosine phosphatase
LIDLHSHVLPGLDDGVRTIDEALELCAAAAADGVEVLAATPHVRDDYPTTPEQMEEALGALRAADPAVRLVPGGELDLAELDRPKDELARFGLGGSRWLLVETPYWGWPLDIAERLFRIRVQGFGVVLAHPERNTDVQERPDLLEPLLAGGTLVQVTAASVDGRLGKRIGRCALRLIHDRMAHLIASDAHAPDVRSVGLRAAVAAVSDDALTRWLTYDVPQSILQDAETPPPRPMRRPRRWWLIGR